VKRSWEPVLRHEFSGDRGSFLVRLRVDVEWDSAAFERLTAAMESCCRELADDDQLERWLAEGFWYADIFTTSWTTHQSWQGRDDLSEIAAGRERLAALADWFFTGQSPYGPAASRRAS
jgi:hypothetical protein